MHSLIEAGLNRPWYRLRLPGPLEARFRAETDGQGGASVRSWLAVFILFNVLSLPMDYDAFGPDAVGIPIALTLGVFCPLALAAILSLRGRPSTGRQAAAALVAVLADIAIVLNSARLVPAPHRDAYIIIAAIVPLVCGLIAPLPFRHALWFCGTSLVAYVSLVMLFGLAEEGASGLPLLVAGLVLVPLKLSHSREWQAKETFLHATRQRLQGEALADANARLTVLSQTDALTTLANRRYFTDRLEETWRIAGLRREWLSVALIDIDHFKLLNDTAGHAVGDHCLRAIAEALRGAVRPYGGLVARYGGEEFVALIPQAPHEAGLRVGEALRLSVADLAIPHPGLPGGAGVSVSVGVTSAQGQPKQVPAGDLLMTADLALYAAKGKGRNRVEGLIPAANANATVVPFGPRPVRAHS